MSHDTQAASAALPLHAANIDFPYHDLFSATRCIGATLAWPWLRWGELRAAVEAAGRPVEAMTVGELLGLIEGAQA